MDRFNDIDVVFSNMLWGITNAGTEVHTRNAQTKRLRNKMIEFVSTPLVTVRRTAWKSAIREMEWFLSGSNNIKDLHESVKKWWEPWANESGFIHNNYSKQFRNFDGAGFGPIKNHHSVDQIKYMIDTLIDHPNSRRNVITTWHTHDMMSPNTPITNCHGTVVQAFVEPEDNSVHLTMYQRSADMVLGVPHNWIQYWAFMMYLAYKSHRKVGSLTWIGGDCHVYPDHKEMVLEMNKEVESKKFTYEIPDLVYNPTSEDFKADDFSLDSEYTPLIKKSLKMTV